MAAVIFHEPVFATIVESGDQLYFYEVGTTTDLTVYLDAALAAPAPQPIVADAAGRFPPIYIDSTGNPPKVVLDDASNVQKWTADEYPIEDTAALTQDVAQLKLDVEEAEGDILTLQSSDQQQDAELADHESRIATLEGEEGLGLIGAGARVRRTSDQTAQIGDTTVSFDSTDFDDASISVSNVLTVPTGVTRVIVTAGVRVLQNDSGLIAGRIEKNSSGFSGQPNDQRLAPGAPVTPGFNLSTGEVNVSAGDTFQFVVTHALGGAQTILAGAWMNMVIMK